MRLLCLFLTFIYCTASTVRLHLLDCPLPFSSCPPIGLALLCSAAHSASVRASCLPSLLRFATVFWPRLRHLLVVSPSFTGLILSGGLVLRPVPITHTLLFHISCPRCFALVSRISRMWFPSLSLVSSPPFTFRTTPPSTLYTGWSHILLPPPGSPPPLVVFVHPNTGATSWPASQLSFGFAFVHASASLSCGPDLFYRCHPLPGKSDT